MARANRLLWRDLAILALVAASALVAARLVARALIIRPVNALLETTKEIAAGSFASRADTRSRGELGRLAGAFNRMANTIQKRQAELDASLETLRQTNEKLRSLVQASPLAIVLYDAAGRIQLWNPAAESMFGWREHELLGQPPDRQGEIDGHRVRSLGGEVLDGVETVGQARDGRHLDVRVFSAVLHDASGRVNGVLVVYEDITARKRAEQEAARQREALFRSEKLADLGRLAAGVAHELRNPLTVVDGRAQMLKRLAVNGPVGPDTLGGHLDSLEEAVNRMRRIVHGLSTYGKPERIDRAPFLQAPSAAVTGVTATALTGISRIGGPFAEVCRCKRSDDPRKVSSHRYLPARRFAVRDVPFATSRTFIVVHSRLDAAPKTLLTGDVRRAEERDWARKRPGTGRRSTIDSAGSHERPALGSGWLQLGLKQ